MMIVGLFANPILVFKMGNDTAWDLEGHYYLLHLDSFWEPRKASFGRKKDRFGGVWRCHLFCRSKIKLTKTQQRAYLEKKDYQKVLSTITACDDNSLWWIIELDIDCLRAYSFFNISQWWAKNQKRCTYNILGSIVCLKGWNHYLFCIKISSLDREICP